MGVVVGKGKAVAVAVAGVVDRVLQAAGLADDGDRAVAAGDHLGQAAGSERDGIRKMSAPA